MQSMVRADNPKLAAIVGTLKSRPPVNFNVQLHTHAIGYGVNLKAVKYAGPKIHLAVQSFNFEKIKAFARSLPSKFPHVIHTTQVALGTPAPVTAHPKSKYLTI
jgi:tRNA(Leu) C34 or U34 (ribose-2'-O)-methylase TrmL